MTVANLSLTAELVRTPSQPLESRTFKEGAIYLYRRADYVKPIWFIRLKVPGAQQYIWRSSKTTDEYAAYRVAEDLYNKSLGKIYAGVKLDARRVSAGIDAFVKSHQGEDVNEAAKHTVMLAKRIRLSLNGQTFDELDTPLIGKMLGAISQRSKTGEMSPNTIRRTISHLKLMMNWWLENGYLEKLPTFPKVAAKHNRRPHFDLRDWETLTNFFAEFVSIKHAPTRRDRILLVNYVLILASTGIRVGEARMLKWRDIRSFKDPKDAERTHVALMVNGKTGKREAVAHSGGIINQFDAILKLRQTDLENPGSDLCGKRVVPLDSYVFCGRNGKPILSFKNSFSSLMEKARVAIDSYGCRRTIYSLRHTYATFRLQEGVNPYILAKNMGTSVAMLEDFYGHTCNAEMVEALARAEHSGCSSTRLDTFCRSFHRI